MTNTQASTRAAANNNGRLAGNNALSFKKAARDFYCAREIGVCYDMIVRDHSRFRRLSLSPLVDAIYDHDILRGKSSPGASLLVAAELATVRYGAGGYTTNYSSSCSFAYLRGDVSVQAANNGRLLMLLVCLAVARIAALCGARPV